MNSICNKLKRYHLSHETCFFDTPNPISWVSYMGYLAGNYPPCMKVNVFLVGKGWIFSTFAIFEIHREGWKYIVLSGKKRSMTEEFAELAWRGNLHLTMAWHQRNQHHCRGASHIHMKTCLDSWNHEVLPLQAMQDSAPNISKSIINDTHDIKMVNEILWS